jgi:hypothetical protein
MGHKVRGGKKGKPVIVCPIVIPPGGQDTVIQSNGLTFVIAGGVPNGTFVTGDPWVAASSIVVRSVSPAWDGTTNGSMVNPDPAGTTQGYDNRTLHNSNNAGTSPMNFTFANGVRTTFPVTLAAGDSLISTIGKADNQPDITGGGATHIAKAACLTVMASPPPVTAFRPPYVSGSNKVLRTTANVNYGLLPGLASPGSLIDMSGSSNFLNKIWLHHGNLQTWHSQINPSDHMQAASNGYPSDMAGQISQMACACLLNIPAAQSIANRLIQYGIDLAGCMTSNTETWARVAGFPLGRKWPILFAGLMLNDSVLKNPPLFVTGSSGQLKFGEDAHTYYGDPGGTTPRWGEDCAITAGSFSDSNHTCRPSLGNVDQWTLQYTGGAEGASAGGYENQPVPSGYIGVALAARLMSGAMTLWNHAEFFDYVDRFVNTEADEMAAHVPTNVTLNLGSAFAIDVNKYGGDGNGFMTAMWTTYR